MGKAGDAARAPGRLTRASMRMAEPATLRALAASGVALAVAGAVTLGVMGEAPSQSAGAALSASSSTGSASLPSDDATGTGSVSGATSAAGTPSSAATSSSGPKRPDHRVVDALAANGIPTVALNAYRRAAARLAAADPSCGVPWYVIAAIGRVESDHGRYGGAELYADGESLPHIIGIALDGTRSARIPDTDHGRLDGDTVWDHAVGPMQFIPSTWAEYAVDGNGDGRADVFNIDDASLATGHYLCVAGGDLHTADGVRRAILAYNDSAAYLATVTALAADYAAGVVVDTPITGPTTGGLPPVGSGPVPPVDPGVPPVLAGDGGGSDGGSGGGSTGGTSAAGGSRPHTTSRPTRAPSRTPARTPRTRPTTTAPAVYPPAPGTARASTPGAALLAPTSN